MDCRLHSRRASRRGGGGGGESERQREEAAKLCEVGGRLMKGCSQRNTVEEYHSVSQPSHREACYEKFRAAAAVATTCCQAVRGTIINRRHPSSPSPAITGLITII
ncbi:hypothetical protein NQZ68_028107 [Dissostichus eleginoides]|nr:hypothetical protein NQZ68_028107 [Dissostichus eleginoides]